MVLFASFILISLSFHGHIYLPLQYFTVIVCIICSHKFVICSLNLVLIPELEFILFNILFSLLGDRLFCILKIYTLIIGQQ